MGFREVWPSGQWQQTVNLPGLSPTVVQIHPPPPVFFCGSNSGVESQPSKLLVAGSNPVSRSKSSPSGARVMAPGFGDSGLYSARMAE